jgi:hypothetical protein
VAAYGSGFGREWQSKKRCIQRYKQSDALQMSDMVSNKPLSAREVVLLKEKLFACFKEFTAWLKKQCPSLTEEELLFCICLVLDFSKNTLRFITNTSRDALKMRRSRLKKKLSFKLYEELTNDS